ncbi:Hypothetical predicted protein [Pelobates cultripes]|uniref:Uncharacterized protein n=1 Tax=Pelobates cultripes TaxID=61616 RepID=A0AAD1R223_PELCU|nr:Hypothetical predicted protein [Pelobates cultripes]
MLQAFVTRTQLTDTWRTPHHHLFFTPPLLILTHRHVPQIPLPTPPCHKRIDRLDHVVGPRRDSPSIHHPKHHQNMVLVTQPNTTQPSRKPSDKTSPITLISTKTKSPLRAPYGLPVKPSSEAN